MTSRRPGHRFNRGRIATAVAGGAPVPTTPLTILGANLTQWVRADLGVTIATGVSAWADQSGNARDYSQGTAANQPAFDAAAGPNSTAVITADGSNDFLDCAAFTPGPKPIFVWAVFSQITWTSTDRLLGPSAGVALRIASSGSTPNIIMIDSTSTAANTGAVLGSFFRLEGVSNNAAGDYIKIGSVTSTGDTGALGAGTGRRIFSGAGAQFGNFALCELAYGDIIPSAQQLADLDAYCTARYGAGLV